MNEEFLKFIEKNKDLTLDLFSKGFKNFLERKHYSTKCLAEMLGVTDSAVSSWKYGRAFPDVPNLIRLFVLGLSPYEIMDKTLETFARNGDDEFIVSRIEKEIEFIQNSSIKDELASQYLEELQKERFIRLERIKEFYKKIK